MEGFLLADTELEPHTMSLRSKIWRKPDLFEDLGCLGWVQAGFGAWGQSWERLKCPPEGPELVAWSPAWC